MAGRPDGQSTRSGVPNACALRAPVGMKGGEPIRRAWIADWARFMGALSLPVLALGALGTRAGFVPFDSYLAVTAVGFGLAVAALVFGIFALVDIWRSGADGAEAAIGGIVYASPALVLLGLVVAGAIFYPRLTDVSTDLGEPPLLAIERTDRPVPEEPDAGRQVEAYPDLVSHVYPLPAGQVFDAAKALTEERGWDIVRESRPPAIAADELWIAGRDLTDGILQAVVPTMAFGFPEDVTLRVRPVAVDSAAVDMRSASRTGRHDLGQNARRIRRFLVDLDLRLQEIGALGPPVAAISEEPAPADEETSAGQ